MPLMWWGPCSCDGDRENQELASDEEEEDAKFLEQSIFSIQLWFKKRKYLFIYFLVKKNKTKENTIWLIFVLVCIYGKCLRMVEKFVQYSNEGGKICFSLYFLHFILYISE